jgi:hypothetical protein
MLKAERLRVLFPMRLLDFLTDITLPAALGLGSTQPLTEMSTRNLPGDKGWLARKADNLTDICKPTVYRMWEPQHLTTVSASMACYRDRFTFYIL